MSRETGLPVTIPRAFTGNRTSREMACIAFGVDYRNVRWHTASQDEAQIMDRASAAERFFLLAFLLLSSATFAQSYQSGKVVQFGATQLKGSKEWEFQYLVRVDDKTVYEITRHSGKRELAAQQTVKYRLEKNHMYIVADNGKEIRFDIVPQK